MHIRPMTLVVAAGLGVQAVSVPQGPGRPVAIRDVSVVDVSTGRSSVQTVLVRDGLIASMAAAGSEAPSGADVVDGRGRFLIPGLWDMHLHLAIRPEPQMAEQIMLPLLLASGITGVRDMGGPLERVLKLRADVRSGQLEGPRIMTPGPFLDGQGDGDAMFRRVPAPSDAAAALHDLDAAGVDFFKVQAGLSAEAHGAIVKAARATRTVVAGHIPLSMTAAQVAASGQRSIDHVSPALVGDALLLFACSSQESDLRAELLAIERARGTAPAPAIRAREAVLRRRLVDTFDPARAQAMGDLLKRHDVWIVPTLVWSRSLRPLSRGDDGTSVPLEYVPSAARARLKARRAGYLATVTEADLAAASDVARVSARAVRAMHDAGARVLAGTDAFDGFVLPGFSLHQELALLVEAGLTPLDALRSATLEAAAYRGDLDLEGTITKGKRANLVLLDADPLADISNAARIHAVVASGRLYRRADLDGLLARARNAAR